MPSFEDLGLRQELLRTLEDEDLATPTALQEAVIPALRRGGNLVARVSSGSGKTLAYTLGVLDRFAPAEDDEPTLRVLVITPDAVEAARVAAGMTHPAQALGLRIAAPAAAWGTPPADAGILVGTAPDLMAAVRGSEVKLDAVEAVVIDGASTVAALGHLEQVDDLLDLVPRDAQRVLISSNVTPAVEDLIERRVKRALRYPVEPAVPERTPAELTGSVGYVVTADTAKLSLLAEQLVGRESGSPPPIIFCRNDERAAELAEALSTRGFAVGQADDLEVDVAIAAGGVSLAELIEEMEADAGQTISYDVPPDAETLRARHEGDDDAIVLIEARELAHLQEIARQAGLAARPTPLAREIPAHAADVERFRAELRSALATEDLAAQFLVLAPLFEEFTAAEVAAAASVLLRSRRPAPQSIAPVSAPEPNRASRSSGSERAAPSGPAPVTWARLFVGLGSRDDVRPGDLLGALAGEAGIQGSRFGKIEIRDSFSIVEVQADVADRVIQAVNGTTIKGRSVRVDYDRGGPARRPPGRGDGPRRTNRRPPRE